MMWCSVVNRGVIYTHTHISHTHTHTHTHSHTQEGDIELVDDETRDVLSVLTPQNATGFGMDILTVVWKRVCVNVRACMCMKKYMYGCVCMF
jgi:hypothetical protein